MKSVVLAVLFTLAYLALITAVPPSAKTQVRARIMTKIFLATLPLFVWAHVSTPNDLGFIPEVFIEQARWVDLGFGLLVYVAGFFGGVLQLYNLAERGFSLRILIDIDE